MMRPRGVSSMCQVNNSCGTRPEKSRIPSFASEVTAAGVIATGCGFASNTPPTNPPTTTPRMKTRFHSPAAPVVTKVRDLPWREHGTQVSQVTRDAELLAADRQQADGDQPHQRTGHVPGPGSV